MSAWGDRCKALREYCSSQFHFPKGMCGFFFSIYKFGGLVINILLCTYRQPEARGALGKESKKEWALMKLGAHTALRNT